MDSLIADLRFAVRSLLRAPLVSAAAVLTLAVGIGANTAIFSVVRGVLLMPLPYEDAGRIVRVWPERPFSKEMAVAFRERAKTFSAFTIYASGPVVLRGADGVEEWPGISVLGGHFDVLGAALARGRGLTATDEAPGAPRVAVVSHELWQRRFGGAEDVVGRVIDLDGTPTEIIGVAMPGLRPLATGTAVWRPLTVDPADADDFRDMIVYPALARLGAGVDPAAAQADVRRVARSLHAESPDYHDENRVRTATVQPLKERMVGNVRTPLSVLFAAAGLVLAIACANVATLLLARGARRRGEITTRAALGASRPRLLRQLLTESGVLALAGGVVGALAAWWLESLLIGLLPASLPRLTEVRIAPYELAFALVLSVLTVLAAGLVPAATATRRSVATLRSDETRGSMSGRRRPGGALVAIEVALAVVLVVGSGLMLKSLWQVGQEDPGFEAAGVLTLRLRPSPMQPGDEARRARLRAAVSAVKAVPETSNAALIDILPMTGSMRGLGFSTPDHPTPAGTPPRTAGYRVVSDGYFETLGIPLLRGRGFEAGDRVETPAVGVINATLAEQLWPAEDAVGKELRWPDGAPWLRIVGVVGDVRQAGLDRPPRATVYQSVEQADGLDQMLASFYLVVRTAGAPPAASRAVADAVRRALPDATVADVRPLAEIVGASADRRRFLAHLLSIFGGLAVFLAAMGLYGVGAHAVGSRVHEIGVRMALGARSGSVARSVLAGEARAVAVGAVIGLAAAIAAGHLVASELYGVAATDAGVLLGALGLIAAVAAVAGLAPALRAARVDPVDALRGG